jgi:hypothetical protein
LTAFPFDSCSWSSRGWVNRHQLDVIEYLREENRVLKEQIGKRRLRLTDAQRRRLAARGYQLGRQVLQRVATMVTPDGIVKLRRQLAEWADDERRCQLPWLPIPA